MTTTTELQYVQDIRLELQKKFPAGETFYAKLYQMTRIIQHIFGVDIQAENTTKAVTIVKSDRKYLHGDLHRGYVDTLHMDAVDTLLSLVKDVLGSSGTEQRTSLPDDLQEQEKQLQKSRKEWRDHRPVNRLNLLISEQKGIPYHKAVAIQLRNLTDNVHNAVEAFLQLCIFTQKSDFMQQMIKNKGKLSKWVIRKASNSRPLYQDLCIRTGSCATVTNGGKVGNTLELVGYPEEARGNDRSKWFTSLQSGSNTTYEYTDPDDGCMSLRRNIVSTARSNKDPLSHLVARAEPDVLLSNHERTKQMNDLLTELKDYKFLLEYLEADGLMKEDLSPKIEPRKDFSPAGSTTPKGGGNKATRVIPSSICAIQ